MVGNDPADANVSQGQSDPNVDPRADLIDARADLIDARADLIDDHPVEDHPVKVHVNMVGNDPVDANVNQVQSDRNVDLRADLIDARADLIDVRADLIDAHPVEDHPVKVHVNMAGNDLVDANVSQDQNDRNVDLRADPNVDPRVGLIDDHLVKVHVNMVGNDPVDANVSQDQNDPRADLINKT